jgi:hypothetical protein
MSTSDLTAWFTIHGSIRAGNELRIHNHAKKEQNAETD